jgi:signal transduction histidine kinase/CheY-like chemotaxis protein/CHASE3 domain sensor protein
LALGTNRLLLLIAAPVFFILLVVAFFAYRFGLNERREQAWVLHTYRVMDQARKVLSDVQDAETGNRGYLLTRQDRYLKPLEQAIERINGDLAIFARLTTDNPREQARARVLRGLASERVAAFTRARNVVNFAAAPASPQLLAAMDAGKAKMDALRAIVAAALDEESRLLQQRVSTRHAAERQEVEAALAAAAIAFFIIITATLLLVRNNVQLAASESDRRRHAILLQATLDNIRDGVAVFDGEGKLVAFNSNFFGCMGFPTELAVQGADISRFDQLADQRKHVRFMELPFVTGGYGSGYRDITFDNRHIEIYRNHVSIGGFLVACLDVTQRVQSEMALRQAQKMETIGQLTGGVAHDFNNLLQIIGANLDLLVADTRGNERNLARLQSAISAVERGSRLTGQLLSFARRQALAPGVTNLGRLLPDMADLLRRTLGERVELEFITAGGLWNTLVDQSQLENAVLNLAINARDAMPTGGKLTIELANASLDETYAKQESDVKAGQYVLIAVSDTGTGMPPEIAARAFEPFFTTKPEGQGTGLGLSQVYGFVKQSGGHIKIYSEAGEGTTVKLYLPRSKLTPQWSAPSLVEPMQGSGETVLVVEDDEAVRSAVTDMLTELGYSVMRAEHAEQALELLKSGAKADLLFTDVVMPGAIGARELGHHAKEIHPDIKVLFTSGYTQNSIVHNGRLDEGVELLSKPYRKDELARKLRSLLQNEEGNAHKAVPTSAPQTAATVSKPTVKSRKVLVVEDSTLIRMTVVDMVEEIGLPYAEAGNADEALQIIEQDPEISILLTDLGLPGMSGAQLVRQAKKIRPDLVVVIASGYSDETLPEDKSVEHTAYLQKPFTLIQLRAALGEG